MKKKIIKIQKVLEILLKICIALSIPCVSLVASYNVLHLSHGFSVVCATLVLSFMIGIFLLRKMHLHIWKKTDLVFSILVGLYAGKYLMQYGKPLANLFFKKLLRVIKIPVSEVLLLKILYFAIIPATIFYAYLFIKIIVPKIVLFLKSLTKVERRFLKIIVSVGMVAILVLGFSTNLFYHPTYNHHVVDYDVMYTTDTGNLLYYDVYTNISMVENDVRQPLFGLFAFPFGLFAHFVSQFLFFIPTYTYELVMVFIQIVLLAFSLIMLARILKIREKEKKYFYLLYVFSFPYLLFSFVLEQYVIALFYLILALYLYFNSDKINYAFIGATGTLLTSGIIFPVISKFKNCKQWIKEIFWCAVIFFVVMTLSGQLVQVPYVHDTLVNLSRFTGDVSFTEKMYQFTNFVKGIFVAPLGEVVVFKNIPSYHLKTFTSYNIVGILLLLFTFISFVLHRKEKISVIAFLWILFSFIILVVVGWGTAENGLILYSLYFAWAYLLLIYQFIRYLVKDDKKFGMVIVILVIVLCIFNFKELYEIIKFGLRYYKL